MLLLTELGARLKEARLAKGYSLEDLQEITKIQKRYLIGIEEGNYSIMPGSFYVRAFIKQYAEAVGLDPEELLDQFKKDVPGSQTEEVVQSYTQSPSRRKLANRSSNKAMEMMPKITVALFIIVIIAVISILYWAKSKETPGIVDEESPPVEYVKPQTNEPNTDGAEGTVDEEGAEEEPLEEEEPPTVAQVISPGAINGDDVNFEVSGTNELKIRVEITNNASWIAFRNTQGVDNLGRVYNPSETVEYDATTDGYVRIRVGSVPSAKVYVNDELLTSPSDRTTQNFIIQFVQE
ncbi:helix-turn-helix domain-containing protein [Lysinibacillus sp. LZ02]|uniref:helix-turn-helix domain-containing protein n=1 Tax=Lysinibacillus sp. LZ02 TaxID=3420668 RepID=UPI003D369C89